MAIWRAKNRLVISPARKLLENAAERLPTPNGVALAIMESWEDERTTVAQLSHLVQTDPALSGRLLKLANSAAMGNRPIVAIPDAIVRVGMQTVGQLAVAFSLIDGHGDGRCDALDYQAYWSHCLLMAVLSRHLAQATGVAPPADLFACGLLARVGILAFATIYPAEYSNLLESDPSDMTAAEQQQFGTDHNELSEAMLAEYRVPKAFSEPARHHEAPELSGFDISSRPAKLANILHLAHRLAAVTVQAQHHRPRQAILNPSLAAKAGLEESALSDLFDRAIEEWREWSKLLELPARERIRYEQLESSGYTETAPDSSQPLKLRAILVKGSSHTQALESSLTQLGVRVQVCQDRHAALRSAIDFRPHLFFVPSSEVTLCRLIRATSWGNSVYLFNVVEARETALVIECLEAGADAVINADMGRDELGASLLPVRRLLGIDRAWRDDRRELRRIAKELALAHRQQQILSLTDSLTKLPNRRAAMETIGRAWSRSRRTGAALAVVMIDIDHFKSINDQHGHAVGDRVLTAVAKVLKKSARGEETIARIGGEEFLLIGPNSNLRDMLVAAERLRKTLASASIIGPGDGQALTISLGVAEKEDDFADYNSLLNAADAALYNAKSTGRNRICFFEKGELRALAGS